jgi:hypothetical protein
MEVRVISVATDQPAETPSAASPAAGGASDTTVFRAFEVDEFREWPPWERLLRMLRSNGGSFGLSGARGAGKSWLMMRAIEWVKTAPGTGKLGGIGLWYPSPSEYDSHAFLASLSDSFATEIDRWYRRNARARIWAHLIRWVPPVAGLVAGVTVYATVTGLGTVGPLPIALASAVAVALLIGLTLRIHHPYRQEARLAAEAKLVRERARYSITQRESTEASAEGGRGLVGRVRTARERELVERPATLSSLVNDFRALAREAGEVAGHVVIAIDELDKMVEPELVNQLLRDIKGVFEVPRVHFLVSVSDEAARSLSMGALFTRDVFNSSFYAVLEVTPTEPDHLAELLVSRSDNTVSRDIGLALGVLAGGNPREAVRLAELAREATTRADAVCDTLRDEALNLRREVVTAQDREGMPPLGHEARVEAFKSLPEDAFRSEGQLCGLAAGTFRDTLWQPSWTDATFVDLFGEAWRRLMVKLAVGAQLIEAGSLAQDRELALRLRDVVVAVSQSARVARTVLEGQLRIETEGPSATAEEARAKLLLLGREYEEIRRTEPSGKARTRHMDAVAAGMRAAARDAHFSSEQLVNMIQEGGDGTRTVALAVVQTTGDPATFDAVEPVVREPRTPFEGYQALLALETLLAGLTAEQRSRVLGTLDPQFVAGLAADDPPRARLANRILRALGAPAVKSAS